MVQVISLGPCRRPIEFLTSWYPCGHLSKIPNSQIKDFFVISHGHKYRFFVVIWPKKTPRHIKYWPRIDPTKVGHFWKIKILKFDNNKISSIFPIDSLVFYVWNQNFDFFEKNGSILGQYFICPGVFIGQITTKNLSLCSWEIIKKSFRGKLHKNFHFSTLWIWLFGIFDKRPQRCYEVKNSMSHL